MLQFCHGSITGLLLIGAFLGINKITGKVDLSCGYFTIAYKILFWDEELDKLKAKASIKQSHTQGQSWTWI